MHRLPIRSWSALLLVALATATKASEVNELEALLRRVEVVIEVDVVQDEEVVAWLRDPRDDLELSAALRGAVRDARALRSPGRAATALAALVVVDPATAQLELAAALEHPSCEVRAAALALLGELPPREPEGPVRSALLGVLARRPRREAALAIGGLATWGEPGTCLLPILEAVERDSTLTDAGLAALTRIVGMDAGNLSAWWRLWAGSARLWVEHDALLSVVDAGDPRAVDAALEKLGRLPDPRTFAAIERLVRRGAADGRWRDPVLEQHGVAAARALGTLRDPRGRPALQMLLEAEGATEALRAQARWALARLRPGGPLVPGPVSQDTRTTSRPDDLAAPPPPAATVEAGRASSARELIGDERSIAVVAQAVAAVALVVAAVAALVRRRRPRPLRSARTADAARLVARALREIELAPVTSLLQGPEPPCSRVRGPTAPEVDDDAVHVVLGSGSEEGRIACDPAAPADPAWQSVVAGVDELGVNVGRVVARVNGADEQVIYDADAGGDLSLADAMATLSSLRASVDELRVELAHSGASMVVYTSGPTPAPEAAPTTPVAADVGWTDLLAALDELGPSAAEVWAQVHGEDGRRRWPIVSADLAGALAALGELRPQVVQAGVRLSSGSADLVMFEGPPPPPSPIATTTDADSAGLRSLDGSVTGAPARPRSVPARFDVLFPTPDVFTILDAIATHEERRFGVGDELVLLDRDAAPATVPAPEQPARVSSADWQELVRAVEEISSEVEAVTVRGSDGETVVLRGDDEGGLPELVASLRALEGTAAQVRVRLARGGGELVLLDLPVADTPAPASPPMRTSKTWRHVLGSIEAMGEALDAISAQVVGADRRVLFGPGTPERSLAQALSELGDGPDDFQDVKVRLKHSPSEVTLFDRALAS